MDSDAEPETYEDMMEEVLPSSLRSLSKLWFLDFFWFYAWLQAMCV